MRLRTLATVLAVAMAAATTGCATRAQPYRFASPLLGAADVPAEPLPGVKPQSKATSKRRAAPIRVAGGWQADTQQGAIRTVSARGIDARMPVASAEAADAVTKSGVAWSRLPAPHRGSSLPVRPGGITAAIQIPIIREPSDLRGRVGQRDSRDPYVIVLDWLDDLGIDIHPPETGVADLVTWAQTARTLAAPTDIAKPGDLLVFDRVLTDEPHDLVGIAIARDGRGVTEFLYAGNGIIRRGFVEPTRASSRRDLDGMILNTFLRHGKRWPPKGTRFLAGELLSHIVHTH
ncbi:MAG TPA: hypothetical protein VIV11_37315 [Kofleriaceae bacterium]